MKFLGFYPETVAARVRAAAAPPRLLTLGRSLGFGAGGFCVVIVIVMAIAAVTDNFLKKYLGDKGRYAFDALLFILMAGGVFRRLLIAPAPVLRVYVLFAAAFHGSPAEPPELHHVRSNFICGPRPPPT